MSIPGFGFNGVHSSAYFTVNRIRHTILPEITHKTVSIPQMLGEMDAGIELGMRRIEVDVTVLENTVQDVYDLYDDIISWLLKKDLRSFEDDNRPNRKYHARLIDGTDIERIASYGTGTLTFVCPNPLAKGSYREKRFKAGGHRKMKVENKGTYLTDPTIKATFKRRTKNFKIRLNETGDYIRVLNTFKAGDVLLIDLSSKKISINGNVEMQKLDIYSDFFKLGTGTSELETKEYEDTEIEFRYYDKYL